MSFGVSTIWLGLYLTWLVVGMTLLKRLAETRTRNPVMTMVIGGLMMLVPVLGLITLVILALRPRIDELNLPSSA